MSALHCNMNVLFLLLSVGKRQFTSELDTKAGNSCVFPKLHLTISMSNLIHLILCSISFFLYY